MERALGLTEAKLKEREKERKREGEITKWISKHTRSKEITRKRKKPESLEGWMEIHQAQESQAPRRS